MHKKFPAECADRHKHIADRMVSGSANLAFEEGTLSPMYHYRVMRHYKKAAKNYERAIYSGVLSTMTGGVGRYFIQRAIDVNQTLSDEFRRMSQIQWSTDNPLSAHSARRSKAHHDNVANLKLLFRF